VTVSVPVVRPGFEGGMPGFLPPVGESSAVKLQPVALEAWAVLGGGVDTAAPVDSEDDEDDEEDEAADPEDEANGDFDDEHPTRATMATAARGRRRDRTAGQHGRLPAVAPVITTRSGRLAGTEEGPLEVYRGIPYAEPPVGPLRWQPPEPVRPWSGTRHATRFGPSSPQGPPASAGLPADAVVAPPGDEAGCLTLNVWTPRRAAQRPVLVWVHGGSYLNGSSAMASYDAATLAAEGNVRAWSSGPPAT
jgi:hypothetical protein